MALDPMLSFYAEGAQTDLHGWIAYYKEQLRVNGRSNSLEGRSGRDFSVAERESTTGRNDTPRTAEPVNGLTRGQIEQAFISGTSFASPTTFVGDRVSVEEDGSIPDANATNLNVSENVRYTGIIGDGAHGSSGTGNKDFDFFEIFLQEGERLTTNVNTPIPFGDLDPLVVLYDAFGGIVAFNDDGQAPGESFSFDSFLAFTAPVSGNYYLMITSWPPANISIPANPFDPASGSGVIFSEGEYEVIFERLPPADPDYFLVTLNRGDVLGAYLDGPGALSITDAQGVEQVGSPFFTAGSFPAVSDLAGFSNEDVSVAFIAPQPGRYAVGVINGAGDYTLRLRKTQPGLELAGRQKQTIFLDFNGGLFDVGRIFEQPGIDIRDLEPFADFLPEWGIDPSRADIIIERIRRVVEESLKSDIERSGLNAFFDVEVVANTSAPGDDSQFFPQPNTSLVYIGGTIASSGINTIGIANSIDVGNYDTEEVAIVLLDILSGQTPSSFNLNNVGLAGGKTIEDLVVTAVGNVTAHEAGHYLGCFHTDGFSPVQTIMDEGPGGLFNLIGVNPATGVFGDAGTIDVDFVTDEFSTNEGFTGVENTTAVIAHALTFYPFGGRVAGGGIPIAVEETSPLTVSGMLSQNFPNPAMADGTTQFGFQVPVQGQATVSLFDVQGRRVATLFSGSVEQNQTYTIDLDAASLNLKKGTYYYRLDSKAGSEQRTLILH